MASSHGFQYRARLNFLVGDAKRDRGFIFWAFRHCAAFSPNFSIHPFLMFLVGKKVFELIIHKRSSFDFLALCNIYMNISFQVCRDIFEVDKVLLLFVGQTLETGKGSIFFEWRVIERTRIFKRQCASCWKQSLAHSSFYMLQNQFVSASMPI